IPLAERSRGPRSRTHRRPEAGGRQWPRGATPMVKYFLSFLLALALAFPASAGPNDKLPDFGTPADAALSKSREAQIGRGVMLQLRNAGVVVEDPELTEYINTIGNQIASHANNGTFRFNFFVV